MRRLMAVLVLFSWYASPVAAQVQGETPAVQDPDRPYEASTIHRHLGFLLHLDMGGGYMKSSWDPNYVLKGGASEISLILGGAIQENLILGGRFWGVNSLSPTYEGPMMGSNIAKDATHTMVGLGLNITYYWMPANVYISVSPSITRIALKKEGTEGSTDLGIGVHLAIGKEWWVSDHWGLGLAGQFMLSSNKDQGGGMTLSSLGGALAFSATYN